MINFQYDAAHSCKWTQRSQVYGPTGRMRSGKMQAERERKHSEERDQASRKAKASELARIMTDGVMPRNQRRASYVPYVDPAEKRETLYYPEKRPRFLPSRVTNAQLRNGYREGVHCPESFHFPGRRRTGVFQKQGDRPQTAPSATNHNSDTHKFGSSNFGSSGTTKRSPLLDEKTWYPYEDRVWYEPPAKWGGRTLYSPSKGTFGPGDPTSTGTFGAIEPNPRPKPYRSIAHSGRGGGKPMVTPADEAFRTKSMQNYLDNTGGWGSRYFS